MTRQKWCIVQQDMVCPENPLSTYIHEFIHWKEAQEYLKTSEIVSQKEYLSTLRIITKAKLDKLVGKGYNIYEISRYASDNYVKGKYDETYTEYLTLQILGGD